MSEFKLTNLTGAKAQVVISKLLPITNVPIINSINKLEEIDNEYNNFLLPLANNCN